MLTLYGYFSPPTRAVKMLLDILQIDYNYQFLHIMKGEHKTHELLNKNPQRSLPFIEDGSFTMNESGPILIYLMEKYAGKEHNYLFPSDDVIVRAKIQQRIGFASTALHKSFREAYVSLC